MDFKNELNPQQYEAVITKDGPLLVLAGAGSGKTRVITYRIAYLIQNYGVYPSNILAITFTNKAAREMRERVENLMGDEASGMWIGTFHNCCGRMLRMFADAIGYERNFVVYDEDDTVRLVRDILKQQNVDVKQVQPKQIRGIISQAKEKLIGPDEFTGYIDKNNPIERHASVVYKLYQESLLRNNAMDFDDMIVNTVKLLETCEEARNYFTNKFKYVLVDEYQDTNQAQYRLISILGAHGNLCVVGDDDQSIYAFRGADITNILNFEKQFKNCKVIKLEENYRSTSNILNAANGVIKNNSGRKSKALWTQKSGGERVIRYTADNQNGESLFVASEIKRLVENGDYSLGDIVVLYRMNSLSQSVESAFMRHQIPYKVYGGFKFFARQEIKQLINYLRLFQNPGDDQALKAVINIPARKIGEKALENAESIARREKCSLIKVVSQAKKYTELSRSAAQMSDFADMFYTLLFEKDDLGIADFTQKVIENTGLIEMYKNSGDEQDKSRVDNLKEFLNVAKEFENDADESGEFENSFNGFLEYLALSTDMDRDNDAPLDGGFVRLMTIHAAKGLEFPVVFVVGMEESLFPSSQADMEGNIEEERRLCYVAITRARDRLYLLNANERMTFGQTRYNPESRFIRELPDEVVRNVNFRGEGGYQNKPAQKSGYGSSYNKYYGNNTYLNYGHKEDYEAIRTVKSGGATFGRTITSVSDVARLKQAKEEAAKASDKNFAAGDKVFHDKFGEGTVLSVVSPGSAGGNTIIEIDFSGSMKRFALEYTKLKKI